MADLIDPTQTGKYPVVLSDRLLGRESNEIFTGVRYNHKPAAASDPTPTARLKPAGGSQPNTYDLSYLDGDGRTEYAFTGARTVGDGRYVLYFDPSREVFVLDRMDSTFHMNLTRTPSNSDPEALERKYPHIDGKSSSSAAAASKNKSDKSNEDTSAKSKPKPARAKSPPRKKEPPVWKPEKKAAQKNKDVSLALPTAAPAAATSKSKPKPKPKARNDDDEEEEEEDDFLQVEYPDSAPKAQSRDFSPAFPSVRRFDDFMDQRESEADDADGESGEDMEDGRSPDDFKLPSPVNNHGRHGDDDEVDDEDDEMGAHVGVDVDVSRHQQYPEAGAESPNLEDDLEKDLEEAFEAVEMSNGTPADGDDESVISEED